MTPVWLLRPSTMWLLLMSQSSVFFLPQPCTGTVLSTH